VARETGITSGQAVRAGELSPHLDREDARVCSGHRWSDTFQFVARPGPAEVPPDFFGCERAASLPAETEKDIVETGTVAA
jgi:hypothetical protein